MNFFERDINFYTSLMRRNKAFSFAGYSDAEWFCLFGTRPGELTSLGQVMDPAHGMLLLDILRRRENDQRFLVAIPKIIETLAGFDLGQIDAFLDGHGIKLVAYERDMVTDDLAAAAGLFPLVDAVRSHSQFTALIGNSQLWPMKDILQLSAFVGISSPNLHMQPGGIDDVVGRVKKYGQPGLYLVSAGVSAAVIIDRLHDYFPSSIFFDCGSMWDAFVGIGGQREWRAKLYADPVALTEWKRKCLHG